jgi:hypothetical protein
VSAKGTNLVTVTFLKADGTTREVVGSFNPVGKIVGSERGKLQGESMANRGQVPIFEIASNAWKSFFADKVLEIK